MLAAEDELEHAALAGLAVGGPGSVLVVPDGVSTVAAALAALAFVPPLRPTDRPKEAAC